MGLATYKQIRFTPIDGQFGTVQLVINRAGYPDLTQPAADTLLVSPGNPNDYSAPFLESDYALSKKFTTTKGRRAIDDLSIQMRDGFGYKGTVNGVPVNENFLSIFQTFFDVWFTGTAPYKAFILYDNYSPSYSEVAHEGWIDPTYRPSSDPYVVNPLTTSQIWCGSRTLKITALSQAQTTLTWGNVLSAYNATSNPNVPSTYTGIGASDCQEGVPYNGFMLASPGAEGRSNTRADPFSSTVGKWYQAVPYQNTGNGSDNPVLVGPPAAVWPSVPFQNPTISQGILSVEVVVVGLFYNLGDTGTIDTGTTLATFKITHLTGGFADGVFLTSGGAGYTPGTTYHTTATGGSSGAGLQLKVLKTSVLSTWGPCGLVFISLGKLISKIAEAMGLAAFTPATDLKSALDFFAQKAGTNNSFPLDTTAIALTNLWINLNVYAKSHPYDGSFWDNPVGWSPDTPISDVLNGICNTILADFNESYASDGTESLVMSAMGSTSGSVNSNGWTLLETPSEEEPATGPRKVQTVNKADDLKIEAPFGIAGDVSSIEIPIRIHRIGTTGQNATGVASVDNESTTWDSKPANGNQADGCFMIVWHDPNNSYAPVVNPDVWKSLCYLYWFNASNTNVVYPSNWSPFPKADGSAGSWANSFYVVNACFKSGATPAADLQSVAQGNDYFNTRCYHSVAFAALNLPLPTAQTFTFSGITDSTGSIQNVVAGLGGTWRNGTVASQNWMGVELNQTLIEGKTTVKFQAISNSGGFPELTDLAYGPVGTGGTSTSTGGNTTSGGSTNTTVTQTTWNIVSPAALSANTNDWVIGETGLTVARISSTANWNLTGITGGVSGSQLVLVNVGSHFITLISQSTSSAANQFVFAGQGANPTIALGPNGTAWLWYDSTTSKWRIFAIK